MNQMKKINRILITNKTFKNNWTMIKQIYKNKKNYIWRNLTNLKNNYINKIQK